jgi:hypothetical protein
MACPQLPKRLKRLGAVGKEIEPRLRIPLDHYRAALALMLHPVRGDAQRFGQRRHRQVARAPARVRLRAILHEAQLEPNPLDRAGQDGGRTGRAIAVRRQLSGHFVIAFTLGKAHPNLLRHRMRRGEIGESTDRYRDLQGSGFTAAPDNTGVNLIAPCPLDHDLVKETAQ